jgi:VWFA-related protein
MYRGLDSVAVRSVMAAVMAVGIGSSSVIGTAPAVPQQAGSKTVFVVALAKDGRPVTDLTRDEWRVVEDGVDRSILEFKTATEPLDLTLVVDTSLDTQGSMAQLRPALINFTHTIFSGNPGATVSVMDVAGAAVMVADRKKTPADLDKVLSRTSADRSGGAVMLEGMSDAARRCGESPTPRRAIVVVNLDGTPDGSGVKEPRRVVDQVIASGASVWAVSYRNDATKNTGMLQGNGAAGAATGTSGDIGTSGISQNRDPLLELVPPATGGFRLTVIVPTALTSALDQVARALLGQYALTYDRPAGPAPKALQMGQARAGVKIIFPTTPPK